MYKIIYSTENGITWRAWEEGKKDECCVLGCSKAEAIGRLILSQQPNEISLSPEDDNRDM